MALHRARTAFGPEALSRFTQILEEVTLDLIGDGVPVELMRSKEMRTRLAQRLLAFAGSWWTDTQIKQLLLRTLRNEASASRITRPRELSRNQTAKKFRQNNTTVTIT